MGRRYGPRFFEGVPGDALDAPGPFIKAVQRLGWGGVRGLKQERDEIYPEASALSRDPNPRRWPWEDRPGELREVQDLPLTDPALGALRVVRAEEHGGEVPQKAGGKVRGAQERPWRWLARPELAGYGRPVIWRLGPRRWEGGKPRL